MAGNALKRIIEELQEFEEFAKYELTVGAVNHLNETANPLFGENPKLTVGELALIHEYGLYNGSPIPPRSFIHAPLDSGEAQNIVDKHLIRALQGKVDAKTAFKNMGEELKQFLQDWFVEDNDWEPLDDKYAQRKTHAGYPENPLIATGQLYSTLGYRLKSK